MDDVKGALRHYIEHNFLMGSRSAANLGDSDSFLEHQVLDSTGFLELITHLEEAYGIKVLDDEMVPENLDSIAAVDGYVARKRA